MEIYFSEDKNQIGQKNIFLVIFLKIKLFRKRDGCIVLIMSVL
jgi:hypothetical protein